MTPTDLPIGKYKVYFDIEGATNQTLSSTIRVIDKLRINSVDYKLNTIKSFPSKLDSTVTYPNKITNLKEGTDGHYLHLAVNA